MNISMDKKYTLDGNEFTVLTVAKPGKRCVAGHRPDGRMHSFYADGTWEGKSRLVEVSPYYADFAIDEPVMVRDRNMDQWLKRYFAGVAPDGSPSTFSFGSTKWSNEGDANVPWLQCRRPTAQELAT